MRFRSIVYKLSYSTTYSVVYFMILYFILVLYVCSGVLIQSDSKDLSKLRQALRYFQQIPGKQPIMVARIDGGLLLIYEHKQSKLEK